MKGTSLLLVLLLVNLAMVLDHASSLTGWSLVAYTWQDVLVALAFAGLDHGLRKRIGVTPRISWGIYWVLAIYAAINVPVARALSTPLTWPMIRSARGPLADSILLYVTPTNCLVIALIQQRRHPDFQVFRGSIPRLHVPLSTLRAQPLD
jgi:hypothetical protein